MKKSGILFIILLTCMYSEAAAQCELFSKIHYQHYDYENYDSVLFYADSFEKRYPRHPLIRQVCRHKLSAFGVLDFDSRYFETCYQILNLPTLNQFTRDSVFCIVPDLEGNEFFDSWVSYDSSGAGWHDSSGVYYRLYGKHFNDGKYQLAKTYLDTLRNSYLRIPNCIVDGGDAPTFLIRIEWHYARIHLMLKDTLSVLGHAITFGLRRDNIVADSVSKLLEELFPKDSVLSEILVELNNLHLDSFEFRNKKQPCWAFKVYGEKCFVLNGKLSSKKEDVEKYVLESELIKRLKNPFADLLPPDKKQIFIKYFQNAYERKP